MPLVIQFFGSRFFAFLRNWQLMRPNRIWFWWILNRICPGRIKWFLVRADSRRHFWYWTENIPRIQFEDSLLNYSAKWLANTYCCSAALLIATFVEIFTKWKRNRNLLLFEIPHRRHRSPFKLNKYSGRRVYTRIGRNEAHSHSARRVCATLFTLNFIIGECFAFDARVLPV